MIDRKLILIGIVVILIIAVGIYFFTRKSKFPNYMFNKSNYAPISNSMGFSGTPVTKLAQPKSFYEKYYDATLRYLIAVYPMGKDSFKKLNALQLASFYNSLSYYYNCEFSYNDDDLGILPGKLGGKWDPLPCSKSTPLPYPPQGVFFNFYTWQKYNVPYVTSDSSTVGKPYLELKNFGNCRPGIAFLTFKPGKEKGIRPGPGMFWVHCRSIQRNVWYPNSFVNDKQNFTDEDNWKINYSKPITWNYPLNWYKGLANNTYVEVTHFTYGPGGLTTSPGWWYNTFTGTGLFVNLGKTATFRNKLGGVFGLATMLSQTQYGQEVLQKYFKTTDPYIITFGFFGYKGYDPNKKIMYCNTDVIPCYAGIGTDNDKGIPREINYPYPKDFYSATVLYQNKIGIPDNTPTYQGIRAAIDAAINDTEIGLFAFSVSLVPDEPMFFLGLQLGLDTIQLPRDPNSNGYRVFEIIDMRMPQKYKERALKRDYSEMIFIDPSIKDRYKDPRVIGQPWHPEFVKESIQYMVDNDVFTLRDPLDIYNNKKVKSCIGLLDAKICPYNTNNGSWYNLYCKGNKLSEAYKCLSVGVDAASTPCILTGNNPTC